LLDGQLASRCQIFKERLVIPARDAQFHCLPAEPKRLEGLDYTLAILDEAGVANADSYEVLTRRRASGSGRHWCDRDTGPGPEQ
jgi:hypothetical protein